MRPAMSTPLTSATRSGTAPFTAVRVATPRPSTTVSGRLTTMDRSMSYTPGVKIRFFPRANWLLMVATESDGLARKKSDRGMEWPGVGPFRQVGPEEFVRVAGTNTRYVPDASTYRNGLSRLTGVVGKVVYGGFGKDCAGAPRTPAKNWVQTAFDHPPLLLSRTRHCCWGP